MILRTIEYTVTEDNGSLSISPATPQYAGVQGENNATAVEFNIFHVHEEGYLYRVEFVDGNGTGGTTDIITPVLNVVRVSLPIEWTAAGGNAVVRLVVSNLSAGGEEQTLYAVDADLWFRNKQEYDTNIRHREYAMLTELLKNVGDAIDTAEDAADDADAAAASATLSAGAANSAATAAEAAASSATSSAAYAQSMGNIASAKATLADAAAVDADAAASAVYAIAATVQQKLDNGDFDGEDGKDGHTPKFFSTNTITAPGVYEGYLPEAEIGDYAVNQYDYDVFICTAKWTWAAAPRFSPEMVQTTGQNIERVMSQKAVTDELENIKEYLGYELENIKEYLGYEEDTVVGVQVDYQNRTFKRLGGAYGKSAGTDFNAFPVFGGRKRCNVADDGTINAYYGDEGYTEDGSNGQVMVYQPAFYYKVTPLKWERNTVSGLGYHLRKANYYVSEYPVSGFKLHPAFYDGNGNPVEYILLSAYEGSMWDASQNKYINDSVDESIAYAAGDLLCSVAGKKPISGLRTGMGTKANFEAMSNNRGAGWHLETIKATSANQLLMIIELGMMNTQTGIGQGVIFITDNSAYNCSSLTGSTASLGNGSGSATSTINEKGGVETTETASGKVAVTYRGVENPYGNIWKHIQGVNIWGDGSMAGGQPFVCDNLTDFNESSHSDHYHGAGFTLANASGYIKAMGYGNPDFDWLLMPSEIGGDSSLPVDDRCYVTADMNGYKIARFGGSWGSGTHGGGFCWYCSNGVGYRNRTVGGRLLYVPTARN